MFLLSSFSRQKCQISFPPGSKTETSDVLGQVQPSRQNRNAFRVVSLSSFIVLLIRDEKNKREWKCMWNYLIVSAFWRHVPTSPRFLTQPEARFWLSWTGKTQRGQNAFDWIAQGSGSLWVLTKQIEKGIFSVRGSVFAGIFLKFSYLAQCIT